MCKEAYLVWCVGCRYSGTWAGSSLRPEAREQLAQAVGTYLAWLSMAFPAVLVRGQVSKLHALLPRLSLACPSLLCSSFSSFHPMSTKYFPFAVALNSHPRQVR